MSDAIAIERAKKSHHIMIWQATFLMWIMEYANIILLDLSHPIDRNCDVLPIEYDLF